MRKQLLGLAGTMLAIGGFALLLHADDVNKTSSGGTGMSAKLPQGVEAVKKDDSNGIKRTLARITDTCLTKNDLGKLGGYFVDADRDRVRHDLRQHDKDAKLDGRIDQIRQAWKQKYGTDFKEDMTAFGDDFKGFSIAQGEIADPKMLSNWPVDNKDSQSKQPAERSGDKGDQNLGKGRNVAVVYFPAEHNLPEVNVSMIYEHPMSWRLDLPDSIDSNKLYTNLLSHLTEFGESSANWPKNANEAYRLMTHHVMLALYDIPAKQGGMNEMEKTHK